MVRKKVDRVLRVDTKICDFSSLLLSPYMFSLRKVKKQSSIYVTPPQKPPIPFFVKNAKLSVFNLHGQKLTAQIWQKSNENVQGTSIISQTNHFYVSGMIILVDICRTIQNRDEFQKTRQTPLRSVQRRIACLVE